MHVQRGMQAQTVWMHAVTDHVCIIHNYTFQTHVQVPLKLATSDNCCCCVAPSQGAKRVLYLQLLDFFCVFVKDISKEGLAFKVAAAATQGNSFQSTALQPHFVL